MVRKRGKQYKQPTIDLSPCPHCGGRMTATGGTVKSSRNVTRYCICDECNGRAKDVKPRNIPLMERGS